MLVLVCVFSWPQFWLVSMSMFYQLACLLMFISNYEKLSLEWKNSLLGAHVQYQAACKHWMSHWATVWLTTIIQPIDFLHGIIVWVPACSLSLVFSRVPQITQVGKTSFIYKTEDRRAIATGYCNPLPLARLSLTSIHSYRKASAAKAWQLQLLPLVSLGHPQRSNVFGWTGAMWQGGGLRPWGMGDWVLQPTGIKCIKMSCYLDSIPCHLRNLGRRFGTLGTVHRGLSLLRAYLHDLPTSKFGCYVLI